MPLIAIEGSTGRRINILDYDYPKKYFEKGDLFCQLCGGEMVIKHGTIKIQHFAHMTSCSSDFITEPESIEHLIAKELVSKAIKNEWEEYSNCTIALEQPIKDLKRIIDIAMIFKTGWIVAHEIQLSHISIQQLDSRTQDYLNEGIDVIWWFGKDANTPTNRNWAIQKYGACYLLDYEQLQIHAMSYRK